MTCTSTDKSFPPTAARGISQVELLVIGAGSYGLAIAAAAKAAGIEPVVVGDPMGFWRPRTTAITVEL